MIRPPRTPKGALFRLYLTKEALFHVVDRWSLANYYQNLHKQPVLNTITWDTGIN